MSGKRSSGYCVISMKAEQGQDEEHSHWSAMVGQQVCRLLWSELESFASDLLGSMMTFKQCPEEKSELSQRFLLIGVGGSAMSLHLLSRKQHQKPVSSMMS